MDTGQRGQRFLGRTGDAPLDLLGRGSRIREVDEDEGDVDLGKFLERQADRGHQPDHDHRDEEHHRRYRPAKAEFRKRHEVAPSASPSGMIGFARATYEASVLRSSRLYMIGITTRVRMVDTARPPITVIAIGARTSAPSPPKKASGAKPNSVVIVVMMIGRRRDAEPWQIASFLGTPSSRSWLTLSISTIAFLTTMPTKRIRPMNTTTDTGESDSHRAATAPTIASGIENRMTNGCSSDSNCEAITR